MPHPSAYIVVTLKFRKEGKKWVAFCEELGTSTFAYSLKKAEERIKEAVVLHLNTLEDVGERERFFKENNIILHQHKPKRNELNMSPPFIPDTLSTPYIQPIYEALVQNNTLNY